MALHLFRKLFAITIACLGCLVLPAHAQDIPADSRVDAAVAAFKADEKQFEENRPADSVLARKFIASYDAHLRGLVTPKLVATYPTPSLTALFDGVNIAAFYSFAVQPAEDMVVIARELQRRGALSDKQISTVFNTLLSVRRIQEALAWRSEFPKLFTDPLPAFTEAGPLPVHLPTEWVISSDQKTMERRPVQFGSGAQVVVISQTFCHFSQHAIADIQADEALRKRLAGHIKWLAPQSRGFYPDELADWNRTHPLFPMTVAYDFAEWPSIDSWGTPTFYFFRDGALIRKVEGWPKEGRKNELKEALDAVGL